jgi:pimeloyl-ACP methyl ester carboxylesterase
LSRDLDGRLAAIRRAPDRRVHFVTHSFGGIVLRYYLKERPLPSLGRVVMLSPPNGGSELADLLGRIPLVRKAAGPNRPRLGTDPGSLPARLGAIDFDLGVITGDRSINPLFSALIPGPDDGFVAVERAKIGGMSDFLVVPRTHAFIMRSREVIEQTLKFLRDGSFDHRTPA